MAFVAEDDTGLATANSYVTLAVANSHHSDRGRDDWEAASDNDKQQALIRATDYIDQRFGSKFIGDRSSSTQALQWPRGSAYTRDDYLITGVPAQLKKACAEYALISLRHGELSPNPALPVPDESVSDGSSVQGAVPTGEIIKEVIGPLETEFLPSSQAQITGGRKAAQSPMVSDMSLPEYPRADLWIEGLLRSSSSLDLVRA